MRRHNAYEAQIHRQLEGRGVTREGREWVLRALHPASGRQTRGLPDASATPVLRPEIGSRYTIEPPSGADKWDCIIWTPPGDVNTVFYATGQSPCDFSSSAVPTTPFSVGSVVLQQTTLTTYPVGFAQVTDTTRTVEAITSVPSLRPASFRHQYKSITIELDAPAVADQGFVTAAQFAPLMKSVGGVILDGYDSGVLIPGSNPPQNYGLYAEMYTSILPTEENVMAKLSHKMYAGNARDGVYMPLHLAGPVQNFVRSSITGLVNHSQTAMICNADISRFPMGAIIAPTAYDLIGTNTAQPWPFSCAQRDSYGVSSYRPVLDSGYDNVNIGVVIFRGLSGGGGGGSFSSQLTLKVIDGLELTVCPTNASSVFAEDPAPYDPKALEAYYAMVISLMDAYPASYNSLEDMWDALKSAASYVWNKVLDPVISNVAPIVVNGATALATRGLGQLAGRLTGASAPRVAPRLLQYAPPARARSASTARSVVLRAKTRARPKPRSALKRKS